MDKIEFDSLEHFKSKNFTGNASTSKILKLTIKIFRLRNEKIANYVLLSIASLFLILSIILIINAIGESNSGRVEINERLPLKIKAAIPNYAK